MSKSLFRRKNIANILAEGGDNTHEGGLKKVLNVRDLTFLWYCSDIGCRKLQ
ncbi:MAG: hypothetical protein V9E88_16580 [Ferruginibacter sp.]